MKTRIHRALTVRSRSKGPRRGVREDAPISLRDIKTPWLLHVRKPKNRGNAGAGMKAKQFLTRVDQFFSGGAK